MPLFLYATFFQLFFQLFFQFFFNLFSTFFQFFFNFFSKKNPKQILKKNSQIIPKKSQKKSPKNHKKKMGNYNFQIVGKLSNISRRLLSYPEVSPLFGIYDAIRHHPERKPVSNIPVSETRILYYRKDQQVYILPVLSKYVPPCNCLPNLECEVWDF